MRALSYSRTLLAALADDTHSWHTFSVHTHAYNLCTPRGELCALVTPQHGNGPFQVVLPSAFWADQVHLALHPSTQPLTSADLRWLVQGATVWDPRLPALNAPAAKIALAKQRLPDHQQLTDILAEATPAYRQLTERLTQGSELLTAGLQTNSARLVALGAEQLVGLGPGLTPLGDDLLLGWLGGLHLAAEPELKVQMIDGVRQGISTKRTTRLSSLWLHHAVAGEFSETWHQLAAALTSQSVKQTQRTLERIAASGATSGLAALHGFALCWGCLPSVG